MLADGPDPRAPAGRLETDASEPAGGGAPADPDRELVEKALAEHPDGTRWFTELVARHWGRVWSLCQAILLSPHDAEDAAQAAFLKAHRHLGTYRFESTFVAWLARVARNAALDALARRTRERDARGSVGADPGLLRLWSPAGAPDPTRRYLDLRRALARLEPADRMVLLLRETEGVPYAEIAEWLEMTPGAVRMRALRARRRMRAALRRGARRSG